MIDIIIERAGSRELTIFIVMFLTFVLAFYSSKDNENNRQCSKSSERVTEKPECEPAESHAQDICYQSTAHDEDEQRHDNGDNQFYAHRASITGAK